MRIARKESFAPRQKVMASLWELYPSMDLKIHEDADGNVFVKDLSVISVTNINEVMEIINQVCYTVCHMY
jgi:hypothetical protein